MRNILFAALLLGAFIFSGCDDDDAQDVGSFKVTHAGAETDVEITMATLTVSSGQNSASGRSSHKLNISGDVHDESISILVSNWDFQDPPDNAIFAKEYYNVFLDEQLEVGEETETCMRVSTNQNVCEGILISYTKGDKTFSSFSLENDVVLKVDKCDGQRITGTFNIVLTNPYDETDQLVVKGTFTNLPYTVINI